MASGTIKSSASGADSMLTYSTQIELTVLIFGLNVVVISMKKITLLFTCVALAIACATLTPAASASSKYLGVNIYSQYVNGSGNNWCWAAASKSVSVYLGGSNSSVCQYVKWGKVSSSCPDVVGTFDDIWRSLKNSGIGNPGYVTTRAFSSAEVTSELNAGYPMLIRWAWDGKQVGHILAIRGYTSDPGTLILSLVDPARDSYVTGTYDWVKKGGGHTWTHTNYNIRK